MSDVSVDTVSSLIQYPVDGTDAPLSALLRALAADSRADLSVAEIMLLLGDRAFAAAMLVFALPILAPLPPGSNFILGLPLLLITAQLMIGRHTLWLPGLVGRRRVRLDRTRGALLSAADWFDWADQFFRPRHVWFCSPGADRVIGAACFTLALLLFLPIPFASVVPALALSLFAAGMIKRDGALIAVAWLVCLVIVAVTQMVTTALADKAPELIAALLG